MTIYRYFLRYRKQLANQNLIRFSSSMTERKGIVLGVYSADGKSEPTFTSYSQNYDNLLSGDLMRKVKISGPIKGGDYRIFWDIGEYAAVAVVGLSNKSSWGPLEGLNGAKENVRIAAGVGAKALLKKKITNIEIEDFDDASNSVVGAVLATYKYQFLKGKDKQSPTANITLANNAKGYEEWQQGVILAESQNFARTLMETPANMKTPTMLAEMISYELESCNVECLKHDKIWASKKGMNSYLSVAKGSNEPPIFLELTYKGGDRNQPFMCLVGKGITFDSGGISLKPSAGMDEMRADMGGAACVAGAIRALAKLKSRVNIKGLIPICENLPSGKANKPGDVVTAMNGKTICVENTDAEGRLILADALCYTQEFKPKFVLDIATLTGAIMVALGDCVAGAFTNDELIWQHLNRAGSETGDRVWRMPLYKHYTKLMTEYDSYDLNNMGKTKYGGSCKAAAFLQEFIPKETPWVHIDMATYMSNCTDQSYTGSKGMSGRPTRTLVEFILRHSNLIK